MGYFGKNETKVVTPSVIPSVIPMAAAGINGGAGSLLALTGAQLGGLAMAVLASWAW